MRALKYVSVDRIFSKLDRDIKGTDINESDVIEWIGESLEFLCVPQVLVEEVLFLDVKNHHTDMPENLHLITQIARNNNYELEEETEKCEEEEALPVREFTACNIDPVTEDPCSIEPINELPGDREECDPILDPEEVEEPFEFSLTCDLETPLDNLPNVYAETFLNSDLVKDMHPEVFRDLNLKWSYGTWVSSKYYKANYTPIRLATSTFFNSIVCKEKDRFLYGSCVDEYTIVGTTEKKLRFSFKEGQIALSFLKNSVDEETGYPLIPDQISYITAITYYIKWKIAEENDWSGRDGWASKSERAEAKWLKYCRQAKNYMKMPKTLDEYQNLLEQTHYLIPDHRKYYGYFGNLGKAEHRNFQNQRL